MNLNGKVFILISFGIYEEITYSELEKRREQFDFYQDKLFIPLNGMLLEVVKEDYAAFYQRIERVKYLKKLDIANGLVSLNALVSDDMADADICADPNADVAKAAEQRIMDAQLQKCLALLSEDEYRLIYDYFYNEIPGTVLAKQYGVNQSTISRRIDRIISKLKKLMKN